MSSRSVALGAVPGGPGGAQEHAPTEHGQRSACLHRLQALGYPPKLCEESLYHAGQSQSSDELVKHCVKWIESVQALEHRQTTPQPSQLHASSSNSSALCASPPHSKSSVASGSTNSLLSSVSNPLSVGSVGGGSDAPYRYSPAVCSDSNTDDEKELSKFAKKNCEDFAIDANAKDNHEKDNNNDDNNDNDSAPAAESRSTDATPFDLSQWESLDMPVTYYTRIGDDVVADISTVLAHMAKRTRLVQLLTAMGVKETAARMASQHVDVRLQQSSDKDVELALQWLHANPEVVDDLFPASEVETHLKNVQTLVSLGISRYEAMTQLERSDGNLHKAMVGALWLKTKRIQTSLASRRWELKKLHDRLTKRLTRYGASDVPSLLGDLDLSPQERALAVHEPLTAQDFYEKRKQMEATKDPLIQHKMVLNFAKHVAHLQRMVEHYQEKYVALRMKWKELKQREFPNHGAGGGSSSSSSSTELASASAAPESLPSSSVSITESVTESVTVAGGKGDVSAGDGSSSATVSSTSKRRKKPKKKGKHKGQVKAQDTTKGSAKKKKKKKKKEAAKPKSGSSGASTPVQTRRKKPKRKAVPRTPPKTLQRKGTGKASLVASRSKRSSSSASTVKRSGSTSRPSSRPGSAVRSAKKRSSTSRTDKATTSVKPRSARTRKATSPSSKPQRPDAAQVYGLRQHRVRGSKSRKASGDGSSVSRQKKRVPVGSRRARGHRSSAKVKSRHTAEIGSFVPPARAAQLRNEEDVQDSKDRATGDRSSRVPAGPAPQPEALRRRPAGSRIRSRSAWGRGSSSALRAARRARAKARALRRAAMQKSPPVGTVWRTAKKSGSTRCDSHDENGSSSEDGDDDEEEEEEDELVPLHRHPNLLRVAGAVPRLYHSDPKSARSHHETKGKIARLRRLQQGQQQQQEQPQGPRPPSPLVSGRAGLMRHYMSIRNLREADDQTTAVVSSTSGATVVDSSTSPGKGFILGAMRSKSAGHTSLSPLASILAAERNERVRAIAAGQDDHKTNSRSTQSRWALQDIVSIRVDVMSVEDSISFKLGRRFFALCRAGPHAVRTPALPVRSIDWNDWAPSFHMPFSLLPPPPRWLRSLAPTRYRQFSPSRLSPQFVRSQSFQNVGRSHQGTLGSTPPSRHAPSSRDSNTTIDTASGGSQGRARARRLSTGHIGVPQLLTRLRSVGNGRGSSTPSPRFRVRSMSGADATSPKVVYRAAGTHLSLPTRHPRASPVSANAAAVGTSSRQATRAFSLPPSPAVAQASPLSAAGGSLSPSLSGNAPVTVTPSASVADANAHRPLSNVSAHSTQSNSPTLLGSSPPSLFVSQACEVSQLPPLDISAPGVAGSASILSAGRTMSDPDLGMASHRSSISSTSSQTDPSLATAPAWSEPSLTPSNLRVPSRPAGRPPSPAGFKTGRRKRSTIVTSTSAPGRSGIAMRMAVTSSPRKPMSSQAQHQYQHPQALMSAFSVAVQIHDNDEEGFVGQCELKLTVPELLASIDTPLTQFMELNTLRSSVYDDIRPRKARQQCHVVVSVTALTTPAPAVHSDNLVDVSAVDVILPDV